MCACFYNVVEEVSVLNFQSSSPPKDGIHRTIFKWTIPNFSSQVKNVFQRGCSIDSDKFRCGNSSFYLRLFPIGRSADNSVEFDDIQVGLFLRKASKPMTASAIFCTGRLFLLNCEGVEIITSDFDGPFPATSDRHFTHPEYGTHSFLKLATILKRSMTLIPGDRLTCGCYLTWAFEPANLTLLRAPITEIPPVDLNKFQLNFSDDVYSDLTIIIGKKKIRTSKLLMSMQSIVLDQIISAKFSKDEKITEIELQRNDVINIDEIMLEQFIEALKTGVIPDFEFINDAEADNALKWLNCVDYYGAHSFKYRIERGLAAQLNFTNAIPFLSFAEKTGSSFLRKETIQFILMHWGTEFTPESLSQSVVPPEIKVEIAELFQALPFRPNTDRRLF